MPRETKSERIISLNKRGDFSTQEIAQCVGCDTRYVNVVLLRAKHGGRRPTDRAYERRMKKERQRQRREAAHA